MIRAIIIDDEEGAREALDLMIKEHCHQVEIIGFANNIIEAKELLDKLKPDVMFLDIQMPGGSGIELVESYYGNTAIIFTTAYGNHAITAVKLSAFDYLLKPIDYRELVETVNRFEKSAVKSSSDFDVLKELLVSEKFKRISIATKDGYDIIKLDEVVCCEAAKSYTIFHLTESRQVVSSKPISEYEILLPTDKFIRVHRSYIINIDHVTSYRKSKNSEVQLSNDLVVDISRSKKDLLISKLP